MPPKKQIPAPIDRPLSRAYLREFTGWSTAYPPGISDSTSLRIMENVLINRDGSARVRPGLRHLSAMEVGADLLGIDKEVVGTHEPFYLNDGSKAYLFAVRETDGTVGFRVLADTTGRQAVHPLTDPGIDFFFPQGQAALRFTAATTYVKYLQIDNKIFALSNAGEAMRYFTVGGTKTAKPLTSITRPDWSIADKLTVVHPTQAWIQSNLPTSTKRNYMTQGRMDDIGGWALYPLTDKARVSTPVHDPGYAMRLKSLPTRENLGKNVLDGSSVPNLSVGIWEPGTTVDVLQIDPALAGMQVVSNTGTAGRTVRVFQKVPVEAGETYRVAFDLLQIAAAYTNGNIWFQFYSSSGSAIGAEIANSISTVLGRRPATGILAPNGAVELRVGIGYDNGAAASRIFTINNLVICKQSESAAFFSGASGTNYFWKGTPYASGSVYHPPVDVRVSLIINDVTASIDWTNSMYFRAGGTVRQCQVSTTWLGTSGIISNVNSSLTNDAAGSWTRVNVTGTAPTGTNRAELIMSILAVPRGEEHFIDSGMFEKGTSPTTYFDGGFADTPTDKYFWEGDGDYSVSVHEVYTARPVPPPATKTANTLISSTSANNTYSFGFFYTFSNEIGECASSMMTVVRTQRGWPAWRWETPNAASEPSGTSTNDPDACADQLAAYMPQEVFTAARDAGALHWSLYMFTWSDQDPVPVMAMRVDEQPIELGSTYVENCYLSATPQTTDTGDELIAIPRQDTRHNYSNPSRGAQGLVAADRMVVVNDPTAAAVIRWTSNQQGSYTDFSASRGGGYKTLTSGNLFVPACVKLWQNPQSTDTLTILCLGTDGSSTGYYMAPAQVASQSEATNIMGFEETTATPGTVSPYGCEVLNNALYHPVDEVIMKSTANNYNIAHKSITDPIQNVYRALINKQRIVASIHDTRIYYLVHNSDYELPAGCRGNEVWVFDSATGELGTWSRWLTPGVSLRKIEQGNKIYMSLVRPDGIFYFDEEYPVDDVVAPVSREISTATIPWKLETNTQGANKAHDAFAHLQQANVVLGYFQGTMRYGIRSYDIHGKPVEISKLVTDENAPDSLAYDLESYLLIRRDLKEWFFFAESVLDEDGDTLPCSGQISLVQYRYTPVSVNVGYEYGTVETFEYMRSFNPLGDRTTDNGVPQPYIDTRRP